MSRQPFRVSFASLADVVDRVSGAGCRIYAGVPASAGCPMELGSGTPAVLCSFRPQAVSIPVLASHLDGSSQAGAIDGARDKAAISSIFTISARSFGT